MTNFCIVEMRGKQNNKTHNRKLHVRLYKGNITFNE